MRWLHTLTGFTTGYCITQSLFLNKTEFIPITVMVILITISYACLSYFIEEV